MKHKFWATPAGRLFVIEVDTPDGEPRTMAFCFSLGPAESDASDWRYFGLAFMRHGRTNADFGHCYDPGDVVTRNGTRILRRLATSDDLLAICRAWVGDTPRVHLAEWLVSVLYYSRDIAGDEIVRLRHAVDEVLDERADASEVQS